MSGLVAVLMRLLARCPFAWLQALGGALGWAVYLGSPGYRARFRANAAQAGVPWSEARRAVAAAGRMLTELPPLWARPLHAPLPVPVHWEGGERVDAALAAGRGLVLLTPHLGVFEAVGQSYAERWGRGRGAITVLFRPSRKPWLRELVESARQRPGMAGVPATLGGVRQMLRALRRGEVVGLLPDQVPPAGLGVWVPFFGRPAYTMTLAARLVQQSGASLLLLWGERLPRGGGFYVRVSELAEPLPADATDAAAVVNRAMEQLILQCPSQYLWGYDRYKAPREEAQDPGDPTLAPGSTGSPSP